MKKAEQKLRVLAVMDESLVPPENPPKDEIGTADWKTGWDVTSTLRDGVATEGVLDTTTLPAGDYTLRILAADISGNEAV